MIKLKIPYKFRTLLSKKYLDFAEILPKFGGSFIATLQRIREHQRIESERDYKESRAPTGVQVEYYGLRLIEIFHIEEFGKLQNGILQLFPGTERNYMNRESLGTFREFAETIDMGGMKYLGIIFRERRKWMPFSHSSYTMETLPSSVDYIKVAIHKYLSSMIILTLDVHLTQEATRIMLGFQDSHYLSEVSFTHLFPWQIRRSGYSYNMTEHIRIDKINIWHNKLRTDIEECIKPFFDGYFMQQQNKNRIPLLPATELYGITGLSDNEECWKNLNDKSRDWLRSFGYDIFYSAYGNKEVIINELEQEEPDNNILTQVTVRNESFLKNIKSDNFDDKREEIMNEITNIVLDGMLFCTALNNIIKTSRKHIEKIRTDIFSNMKTNRSGMKRYIELGCIINQESMLLKRISMEYEQGKKYILFRMNNLKELNEILTIKTQGQSLNFKEAMVESINFNMKRLQEHVSLIKTEFSDYLNVQNIKEMHNLQVWILWFTAIVTFATLLGLLANWQDVVINFNGIIDRFFQIVSLKK
ncbi:MAG: hypothetical protein WC357_02600 [Candidatus Omnitrophota bacterium]|jgi:hypothetical protein